MKKAITLLLLVATLLLPQQVRADVVFNAENFPDANFRKYLISNFKSKGFTEEGITITTANLNSITAIKCYNQAIADLKGIEHFTKLTQLYCYNNKSLTSLDVSRSTALKELLCYGCGLTELKLTGDDEQTNLFKLHCYNNSLTALDVTKLPALASLRCENNELTELDVTQNTALTGLYCYENQLTTLDVSRNTALNTLYVSDNKLKELDVTQNTALTGLYCYNNLLTELDVSQNTELKSLQCGTNKLRGLDLSNLDKLTNLQMANQKPVADLLILSNTRVGMPCPSALDPDCVSNMKIQSMSLTIANESFSDTNYHMITCNFYQLYYSFLWNASYPNPIVTYDYDTKCPSTSLTSSQTRMSLEVTTTPYVACGDDNGGSGNFPDDNFRAAVKAFDTKTDTRDPDTDEIITTDGADGKLSTAELQAITDLQVAGKGIGKLNGVEYMKFLETLDCSNNNLTTAADLPVTYPGAMPRTYNPNLVYLNCSNNQLTSIEVSTNTELQILDCSHNQIEGKLDLKTTKKKLVELHCGNNKLTELILPSTKNVLVKLTCDNNSLTSLDAIGYTAMTLMDCSHNQLTTLNVNGYSSSVLQTLNCSDNLLTSLVLPLTLTALLDLNCNTNQLTALYPIDRYTNLANLDCGKNKIPTLDLTKNTKLETLDCSQMTDRALKQLTLPGTTTLVSVKCHENSLITLDVRQNTALTVLNCSTNHLTDLDLSRNAALTDLAYDDQTRHITAESSNFKVTRDGEQAIEKLYYLRLDDKVSGQGEMPIWDRMAENYESTQGIEQTFDLSLASNWSGGTVVHGKLNAAGYGDLDSDKVIGDILALTDVEESASAASGTVTYNYDIRLPETATATDAQSVFTLHWTASPKVVTAVSDIAIAPAAEDVTYYNATGQAKRTPWPGVNIAVTRYSDGTTATTKMLR